LRDSPRDEWLAANAGELECEAARRLYFASHSAGGHLAATLLDHPAVAGVLPISGLFDLEPIRLCYLNEKLALTAESASRNSPLLHIPQRAASCVVAVGAAELRARAPVAEYAAALSPTAAGGTCRCGARSLHCARRAGSSDVAPLCAALVELDRR
jgi:acetyl esterase/lipase